MSNAASARIEKRVGALCDQIHAAHAELAEIRKECPHAKHRVGWWEMRTGSLAIERICCACSSRLDGVTAEETEEFMKRSELAIALDMDIEAKAGDADGWSRDDGSERA